MHRTTGTRALRRAVIGGAALALAATMAACGSDDSGGEDTQAAGTSASESADPAEFCEASVALEGAFSMGPGADESAPPEEQQAALEEFSSRVEPLLGDVEDTAPEEISDTVTEATGIVREALSSNDPSMLDGPEFQRTDQEIDEYMLAECGYEELEATGVDYEYEGIPDTVQGGTVAITFHNEGEELHEIGLARINEGVTQSVEELLAMPEDQLLTMVTPIGAAFAMPGESDTVFMEMDAGRYAAVCFVPQGTTHDMEGSGPPHAMLGMVTEFTVE